MNGRHGLFADEPALRLLFGMVCTLGLTILITALIGFLPNNLSKEVPNVIVLIPIVLICGLFFAVFWARKACEDDEQKVNIE